MKYKKLLILIIAILLSFPLTSCKKKDNKEGSEKTLNLYVDIKDKNSSNIIKGLIEEYEKDNSKVKVNVKNPLGGTSSVVEDISKGKEADIIFTSRNTMIELSQKGLLSDMSTHYEKNKLNENYYNIMSSYGRVGDKYFGISLIPYTIEILYNKNVLTSLNIKYPASISDMKEVIKKLNGTSTRIPVVLTEDLDINNGLTSIIASNNVKIQHIENSYDNIKNYKEMKEMQGVFDTICVLVKDIGVNKNTFEIGNDSTIENFSKGSIPLIISVSYYSNSFKANNIGLVDDYTMNNNAKEYVPVIVNSLLCVPSNGKNSEEVGSFIKFIFSEEAQKKLAKKGFITGNKKVNESGEGIEKTIAKHLATADDNNMLFIYNFPKKFQPIISSKIDNMLNGKCTKKEWEEILEEAYK